ncbi:beta-ketoacyl synthase, partial [Frankia sp. Mgl5]|uniref:ketoacyl-synthetase C-terminal extension domain-containing protein n=1 Tax=Frankia sp. Mgl5 TaxID=2933793 RepID=UPI0027E4493F
MTEPVVWPETGRPRRAGVSSFGVSGTNAHVIIEQAPDESPDTATDEVADAAPDGVVAGEAVPWLLSAASPAALRAQADALAEFAAARPAPAAAEIGRSLATTRARLARRAVVVAGSHDERVTALRALGAGTPHPDVIFEPSRPQVGADRGNVFVFPGQGAQWVGMGAGLLGGSSWLS